jgi:hypothetical protein
MDFIMGIRFMLFLSRSLDGGLDKGNRSSAKHQFFGSILRAPAIDFHEDDE